MDWKHLNNCDGEPPWMQWQPEGPRYYEPGPDVPLFNPYPLEWPKSRDELAAMMRLPPPTLPVEDSFYARRAKFSIYYDQRRLQLEREIREAAGEIRVFRAHVERGKNSFQRRPSTFDSNQVTPVRKLAQFSSRPRQRAGQKSQRSRSRSELVESKISRPPARAKKRKLLLLGDSPSSKRFKGNSAEILKSDESKTSKPERITDFFLPSCPVAKEEVKICPESSNLKLEGPKNFLQAYKTKKIPEKVLQSLLPETWSPDCFQNFHHKIIRRKCPMDSPEFQKLNPAFDNSVVEIEKIENPYLWLVFKLKGMETFGDEGQEVRLFHGTEGKRVGPIIKDNFDYRLAGTCRGHRYGKGVNFSFNPIFCKGYAAKGRCIIMARVLMGRIHLGNELTILPDPDFHATGNNRDHVVKYHDHEFYPEFLIHFSR